MTPETIIKLRGAYRRVMGCLGRDVAKEPSAPPCIRDKEETQRIIAELISSGRPMMVARFGSIELTSLDNALHIRRGSNVPYITWRGEPAFLHESQARRLENNAGFFPTPSAESMERFLDLMTEDMTEVDILGSWRYNERLFARELAHAVKVDRELMTPLLTPRPWTRCLEGRRVLVVHPFAETIERQYARREKLFAEGSGILPAFDLQTLKAVQTQAGTRDERFADWFEALQWMKDETDRHDYDIALVGCGAYGFPLAAHCKRTGHQALHIGGVLQLLFGIKGRRWEGKGIYCTDYPYAATYYNDYWVRPDESEKPVGARRVEGGCYW